MQSRPDRFRGYTLIEAMIVVVIISLIALIAVPAYLEYSVRAKIAECINLAAEAKFQISEYRLTLGAWPPSASDAGLQPIGTTDLCLGYDYDDGSGSFAILIDSDALERGLGPIAPKMIPSINASNFVTWNCVANSPDGTAPENLKFLPSTCRDMID